MFETAIALLNQGNHLEAESRFREAIALRPEYIRILHNSLIDSFKGSEDWQRAITAMREVVRLDPSYQMARDNLAIAFESFGIQRANQSEHLEALELFFMALSAAPSEDIINEIKNNLAASFTRIAVASQSKGDLMNAVLVMRQAYVVCPNEKTRFKLSRVYAFLARAQLEHRDYASAIQSLERAEIAGISLAQTPIALMRDGKPLDALAALERLRDSAPQDEVIQNNREPARGQVSTGFSTEELEGEFRSDFKVEAPARIDSTVLEQSGNYVVNSQVWNGYGVTA